MDDPHTAGGPGDHDALRFIGNATLILRLAGVTILTDPNFVPRGERVPVGYGLGTRRLRDPAIRVDELPPLDGVVLSHLHGDHFDRIARERLPRDVPLVTTPQAARALERSGFVATQGLGPWATTEIRSPAGPGHVRVTAMPGRHAPSVLRFALPPVMGSLLEVWPAGSVTGAPARRIYISGDTLWHDELRGIGDRIPMPDIAILHLGGTRVLGLTVTMDGEQGARLAAELGSPQVLPVHHDDYDRFRSPVEAFVAAMEERGLGARVHVLPRGPWRSLEPTAAVP